MRQFPDIKAVAVGHIISTKFFMDFISLKDVGALLIP